MRSRYSKNLLIALLGVAVFLGAGSSFADDPQDILVIVNKATMTPPSMTKSEVRSIFLKDQGQWRGGEKIVVINAKPDTELRKAFRQRVLGLTADEEESYWQKQKIRYMVTAPAELVSTQRATFIFKGAISYSFRKDYAVGTSNVVLVLPNP